MNSYGGDGNRRSGACMARRWNSRCGSFYGTVSSPECSHTARCSCMSSSSQKRRGSHRCFYLVFHMGTIWRVSISVDVRWLVINTRCLQFIVV
jgi:hypothetical protein